MEVEVSLDGRWRLLEVDGWMIKHPEAGTGMPTVEGLISLVRFYELEGQLHWVRGTELRSFTTQHQNGEIDQPSLHKKAVLEEPHDATILIDI